MPARRDSLSLLAYGFFLRHSIDELQEVVAGLFEELGLQPLGSGRLQQLATEGCIDSSGDVSMTIVATADGRGVVWHRRLNYDCLIAYSPVSKKPDVIGEHEKKVYSRFNGAISTACVILAETAGPSLQKLAFLHQRLGLMIGPTVETEERPEFVLARGNGNRWLMLAPAAIAQPLAFLTAFSEQGLAYLLLSETTAERYLTALSRGLHLIDEARATTMTEAQWRRSAADFRHATQPWRKYAEESLGRLRRFAGASFAKRLTELENGLNMIENDMNSLVGDTRSPPSLAPPGRPRDWSPWDAQRERCDVLLIAVAEVEVQAIREELIRHTGQKSVPRQGRDNVYQDFGEIQGARVLLAHSQMGSSSLGGANTTARDSIHEIGPAAVIAVGIAFGVNPEEQAIGTILVSRRLRQYDLQRVGTSSNRNKPKIIPRGDSVTAPIRLLERFQHAAQSWPKQVAAVEFCVMVSGDKLVDHIDFRNAVLAIEPEARGGEMEGAGIYAAVQNHANWLVVKAICDWADGNKAQDKQARQEQAARNAARFVLHVLKEGGLGPPAVCQGRP